MKLMQVNTCTIQRRKLLSKRSRECHLLAPSDRQHEFHTTFLDLEQYDVIRHKKLKHNPCNLALHSRVRSCSFLSFVPSESLDYEQIYGGTDEEEDWRRKAWQFATAGWGERTRSAWVLFMISSRMIDPEKKPNALQFICFHRTFPPCSSRPSLRSSTSCREAVLLCAFARLRKDNSDIGKSEFNTRFLTL